MSSMFADVMRAEATPATRVLGGLRKAASAFLACYQAHRITTELAKLSDAGLKDLGLTRSEIVSIAHELAVHRSRCRYG